MACCESRPVDVSPPTIGTPAVPGITPPNHCRQVDVAQEPRAVLVDPKDKIEEACA